MKLYAFQNAIRVLKKIQEEKKNFSFQVWCYTGENEEFMDPNSCGFAACAIGWMSTDQYFNDLGLHYSDGEVLFEEAYTGYGAVSHIFDIPYDHAVCLFSPPLFPSSLEGEYVYAGQHLYDVRKNNMDGLKVVNQITVDQVIKALEDYIATEGDNVREAIKNTTYSY